MNKKSIILIGGGGHCKSCIDVIEEEQKYSIAGIIDIREKIGQEVLGYKIIGCDDDIDNYINDGYSFLITVGFIESAALRIKLFDKLKKANAQLPAIISPLAYVSKHSKVESGTIVMHNAQINAGSIVQENCIVNSKALIEHDVIIEKHCHISTGAIVNGGVKVGETSFIGSGSVSKQYIDIPSNSFIKANSIVK